MNRMILWLTMLATVFLFMFSLLAPSNSLVWLASTSTSYEVLRVAVIMAIAGLLVTRPPRNQLFRLGLGIFSVGVAYWSLAATYQNHMNFLDTMTLLPFSISCGLTVLELDETKMSQVPAKGMRRWTASLYAAYTLRGGKL